MKFVEMCIDHEYVAQHFGRVRRFDAGLETAFYVSQCATFSGRHDQEVSSGLVAGYASTNKTPSQSGITSIGKRIIFSIECFIDKTFKLYAVLKVRSQPWSGNTRRCEMGCVLLDVARSNTSSITVHYL